MGVNDLKSDRDQRSSHASVQSRRSFVGHHMSEDGESRASVGALLPDSKRIQRITGDYSGDAAEAAGDELFPPAAREKLGPEIHYLLPLIPQKTTPLRTFDFSSVSCLCKYEPNLSCR